jgi:hypothetical protein
MSNRFRNYLIDAYVQQGDYVPKKIRRDFAIQVDDQDNNDNLGDFCSVFVIVGNRNDFIIELKGNFPISRRMADLAEIYDGYADMDGGRLMLKLHPNKIEVLTDLAARIRETAYQGDRINNSSWLKFSARTISSLYRFVRIVKEYQALKTSGF